MDRIAACVRDVLRIANQTEDVGQAKDRIEQLFRVAKASHRGHLAIAQRLRDQLSVAYNDVPLDAQPCLTRVLAWLDREHLRRPDHL
jgi:hypothetical protein